MHYSSGPQYYKTVYSRNLQFFNNKLECLSLASLSNLVQWAYSSGVPFKDYTIRVFYSTYPQTLDCDGKVAMENTLAYYKYS